MKINELICPTCQLRCFTDKAYTTCDACGTNYYASQSARLPSVLPQPIPTTNPWTVPTTGYPIWVVPIPGAPAPYGPTWTCETTN